jgi:hypothetical protein
VNTTSGSHASHWRIPPRVRERTLPGQAKQLILSQHTGVLDDAFRSDKTEGVMLPASMRLASKSVSRGVPAIAILSLWRGGASDGST